VYKVATIICSLLNLNINAGLGWRLRQVTIEEDDSRSGVYRLITDDAFEALTLAQALNALADTLRIKFVPVTNV
jgi:hypothetical protein